MHFLKIPLAKIQLCDSWADAPQGKLLQLKDGNAPVIGMRSDLSTRDGPKRAFLILTGERRGTALVEGDGLGLATPAIDVTSLVEIVALEAAPAVREPRDSLKGGMLVADRKVPGRYLIWAMESATATSTTSLGGVCIGVDQGKLVDENELTRLTIIAPAVGIEALPDPGQSGLALGRA
jgi:hypothetical protein